MRAIGASERMTEALAETAPALGAATRFACRFCGAPTRERFSALVLEKVAVRYWGCGSCGSLQTDPPTWLDEAYASHLTRLDTGVVQRNLGNCAAVLALTDLLGLRDLIDFGGGDGLLCRMLRDYGLNAYVTDAHARPTYAAAFTAPDFAEPQLLTAFEVFEHFADPRRDLERVFAHAPQLALISTELYTGQGADWWYLSMETGQHVFFWSARALAQAAERFGYRFEQVGTYCLFARAGTLSPSALRRLRLRYRHRALQLARAALAFRATPGVQADFERIRAQAAQP